jgi:hypothetical protein
MIVCITTVYLFDTLQGTKMVMIRIRKAQAGLEFLTTYAWAFVVILIIIGALAYFGVTNPARLLPDRCNVGSEFSCTNFLMDADTGAGQGQVRIQLKSNLGSLINASSFTVRTESGTFTCTNNTIDINFNFWAPGTSKDIVFFPCNIQSAGFVAGQKDKLIFNFDYYDVRSGPTYAKKIQGDMYGTIS